MKNQEPKLKSSQQKNSQNSLSLNCSSNNQAKFTCFSKSCSNFALLCERKECQCRTLHKGCIIVDIQNIRQAFRSYVHESKVLQYCICENIDKIIDHLSDLRENYLQNIKEKFTYFGLNESNKDIFEKLETGNASDLTGKILFEGYIGLKENDEIDQEMSGLANKFQKQFKTFENNAIKLKENLDKLIQQYNFEKELSKKAYLLEDSKVVTSVEENDILKQFFKPKEIKSMQLLYRASENSFELKKFHQMCDKIPNIMILIDQQFGNKIGGFTPLAWQTPQYNVTEIFKADHSLQSFLFSIPVKDKLSLKKPQSAIQIRSDGRLRFGEGSDLFLEDKANLNDKSFANIAYTYTNPNYKKGNPDQKARFLGSPKGQYYFKVKEWEAWRVDFAEQTEK